MRSKNKILYAITQGDEQLLKQATQEFKRLPWPYRHSACARAIHEKSLAFA